MKTKPTKRQSEVVLELNRSDEPLLASASAGRAISACRLKPNKMVEPRGLEPLTPTMPLWCSTN